jgi:hypothetical protein
VYKRCGDEQDSDADPQLLSGHGSAARTLRRTIVGAICLLAALAADFSSAAGVNTRGVTVNVCLRSGADCAAPASAPVAASSGVCTSDTLSESTGAVVRVVCATGQFVSIGPRPGGRFIGTQGGAYTYFFGPSFGAIQRSTSGELATGTGTITSFRIYNVTEIEVPLEMLVSF